jgi:hypothetical protein
MPHVIYVVDIGSPRAGLAWARLQDEVGAIPTGGAELAHLATCIARDISAGASVAIGFEAPGFIPVPTEAAMLGRARTGEVREGVSRPWSYGAGAYVTTMAIQIGAWLLRNVREQVQTARPGVSLPQVTLDSVGWAQTRKDVAGVQGTCAPSLLLWEAFVSGPGHARQPNAHGVSEHIQDAATAALAFSAWCSTIVRAPTAVSCDSPISTLGAIAIWAGWTKDIYFLSQQPLVLWPDQPLGANVVLHEARATTATENPVATPEALGSATSSRAATLSVICGDSHSFWRSHQGGGHMTDFDLLVGLLEAPSPLNRHWDVSFDRGVTWHPLVLRMVGRDQISWKGYDARASKASKVVAFVRT